MTEEALEFRFEVALSFPGEYEVRVARIAEIIATYLTRPKVLYYKWLLSENARPNLDLHLSSLYRDQSRLLVFFIGTPYEGKPWCGVEWRVERELLFRRQEDRILLLRLDAGTIEGLSEIDGYLDIAFLPDEQVAHHILERWRLLQSSAIATAETYRRQDVDSLLALAKQTRIKIFSIAHPKDRPLTLRGEGLPLLQLESGKQVEFTVRSGTHAFSVDYWGSSDRFHGMDVYRSFVKSNTISQDFQSGIYEFRCTFREPWFFSISNGEYSLEQFGQRKAWPQLKGFRGG